jgi:hypothetical protein
MSMSGSRHTVAARAAMGCLVGALLMALVLVAPSAHAARHHRAKACAWHAKHHARGRRAGKQRARCAAARRSYVAHRIAIDPSAFHNPFAAPGTPAATSTPADPAPAVATPAPAPAATPTPAPTTGGLGRAVQVQGREFGLSLSRPEVISGTVTVEFNTYPAEDPHSLVLVNENGTGSVYRFDEQAARTVVDKRLNLSRGTWLLFCDIAGHEAKGMKTELTVR